MAGLFGGNKMEQSDEDKALEAESNEIYDMELTDEEKVDRKLMKIGIQEKYAKKYREAFPDKGIFYRGNLLKHFFVYYLDAVENATELQHVEQSFLTPSQVKLLNSKLQENNPTDFITAMDKFEQDELDKNKHLFELITKKTGYPNDEIMNRINGKKEDLKGLISMEGALLIIAKESGLTDKEIGLGDDDDLFGNSGTPQSEGKAISLVEKRSLEEKDDKDAYQVPNIDSHGFESYIAPKQTESEVKTTKRPNLENDPLKDVKNMVYDIQEENVKQTKSETETIEAKVGSANLVEIPGDDYSFITLITGYEGSGKTVAAATFPSPFLISLEKKKIYDLIKYPPLIFPEFGNFKENKDYVIANVMEKGIENKQKTYDNVLKWVNWFKNQVDKKTLVIDTAKRLWDIAWGRKAQQKGTLANPKPLGKVEYIPITTELKGWVLDLMHWCRDNNRSLIFTSHTTGKYIDINQYDSIKTGEEPDAKYWIREAVSWRIDLLKPDQTLMEGKFIADFQKAPGRQYFKIDLTDKKLFEIINSRERLEEEIEIYKSLATPEENDEEGGLF